MDLPVESVTPLVTDHCTTIMARHEGGTEKETDKLNNITLI